MCGMPSESNATKVEPPGTPLAMIASGVRLSTGLVGEDVGVTVGVVTVDVRVGSVARVGVVLGAGALAVLLCDGVGGCAVAVAVTAGCVAVGVRVGPGPPPAQPLTHHANEMQSTSGICRAPTIAPPPRRHRKHR